MFDRVRTALTGQSAAVRAQEAATRQQRKARLTRSIQKVEQELRNHDHAQDPKNNLGAIDNRPTVHRYRTQLADRLNLARRELRDLG